MNIPGPNNTQITLPDQVGSDFRAEHEHAGGYDLHPEFRPWAGLHYYRIYSTAPPWIEEAPFDPAVKFTRPTAPVNLAPQVPDTASM